MRLRLMFLLLATSCSPAHKSSVESASAKAASSTTDLDLSKWVDGATLVTPGKTTYLFRYTPDADALSDPQAHLRSHLAWAATQNAGDRPVSTSHAAGYGLYGAADPFISSTYGRYLTVMPIKAGVHIPITGRSSANLTDLVRDTTVGALTYNFPSYLPTGRGTLDFVTVVHDESVLDMGQVVTIDFDKVDCDHADLQDLSAVSDLVTSLQVAAKARLSCIAFSAHRLAGGQHMDQAFFAHLTDGDYFELLVQNYPNAALKAVGSDLSQFANATNFKRALAKKYPNPKAYSAANFLADAIKVHLLPEDATASTNDDINAAIQAQLKADHPEVYMKIRAYLQFYSGVIELVYGEGMTAWTVQ